MSEIKEDALFVADAHYPSHNSGFMDLLEKIKCGQIKTSQIFLMGDIFDLLFGHNDYILHFSKEAIDLLNELSKKIEIVYLEGNHDFCLKDIFPNIKVFTRDMQPVFAKLNDKTVALSHGDRYGVSFLYEIYTKIIRDSLMLNILKPFQKIIIGSQIKSLAEKNICKNMDDFDKKVNTIVSNYPSETDMIIEGHFHQAKKIGKYISLPSLVCQKQIAFAKNGEIVFESV